MIKAKQILILCIMMLGFAYCEAQLSDFKALLKEKDEIPLSLLSGLIDKKQALSRSEYIHLKLKNSPYHATAFEKEWVDGVVYYFSNEPQQAIKVLKTGIEKIPPKNDTLFFKYQALLAEVLQQTEDYEQAEVYFSKNYYLAKSKPIIEAKIPNELIAFYTTYLKFIKKHGSAFPQIEILNEAYRLSQKLSKKDYLGMVEANYADFYKNKNDYKSAILFLEKSLQNTDKAYYKVPRLLNLVEIQLADNEKNKAVKNLKKCEKLLNELKVNAEEIQAYKLRIAILKHRISPNSKILQNFINQYVNITKNTKDIQLSKAYLLLADTHDGSGLLFSEQAVLSTIKNQNLTEIKPESVLFPNQFLTAALVHISKMPAQESQSFLLKIADVALNLQKSFLYEDQKLDFNKLNIELIKTGIKNTQDVQSVYQLLELANARVLNEVILDKKNKLKTIPPQLSKKEKDLTKNINDWKLNPTKENNKLLANAQMELGFLRKSIEKQNPKYYKLKYQSHIISLDKIQSQLKDREAILNYFLDGKNLTVLIIKKRETQLVKHPLKSSFEADFDAFIKNLYRNPGISVFNNPALRSNIYRQLFFPIEKHLIGIKNLTVVRNGVLNLLPFEVLESVPNAFLMDRFTFSYDYTVSSKYGFYQNENSKIAAPKTLAFAPFTGDIEDSENNFRQKDLRNLQFSEQEVSAISGSVYKNQSATKNNFFENYRNHNVLHFATHAQIDDSDPAKSFIAFFPDSSEYKLNTSDLYNLELNNTQLVILSACEAGIGKLLAGEGLMSLARGFAYSGCKSVITTLWKAHDQSSAWIAARIHFYLENGYKKDWAVQKAKQDFRKSALGKKYEHPYYWANFIIIGNVDAFEYGFWNKYKVLIYCNLIIISMILGQKIFSKFLKPKKSNRFYDERFKCKKIN